MNISQRKAGRSPGMGIRDIRRSLAEGSAAGNQPQERRKFGKMPSYASSETPASMLDTLAGAVSKMPARRRSSKMKGGGYLKANIDGKASRGKTKGRYC